MPPSLGDPSAIVVDAADRRYARRRWGGELGIVLIRFDANMNRQRVRCSAHDLASWTKTAIRSEGCSCLGAHLFATQSTNLLITRLFGLSFPLGSESAPSRNESSKAIADNRQARAESGAEAILKEEPPGPLDDPIHGDRSDAVRHHPPGPGRHG